MDFPRLVSGIGEGRNVAENVVALRVMGTISESLKGLRSYEAMNAELGGTGDGEVVGIEGDEFRIVLNAEGGSDEVEGTGRSRNPLKIIWCARQDSNLNRVAPTRT